MLIVSEHALDQYFFKVCNVKKIQDEKRKKIRKTILKRIKNGFEINLCPVEAVKRLLNNNIVPAKYIYDNGVLFVITDKTVVTCYPFNKNKISTYVGKFDGT